MKKSVVLAPAVQKQLRARPEDERIGALLALLEIGEAFGNPHVHSGLGIRKLKGNAFECRAGLALRFGFVESGNQLVVMILGNHDDIGRWIRDL